MHQKIDADAASLLQQMAAHANPILQGYAVSGLIRKGLDPGLNTVSERDPLVRMAALLAIAEEQLSQNEDRSLEGNSWRSEYIQHGLQDENKIVRAIARGIEKKE